MTFVNWLKGMQRKHLQPVELDFYFWTLLICSSNQAWNQPPSTKMKAEIMSDAAFICTLFNVLWRIYVQQYILITNRRSREIKQYSKHLYNYNKIGILEIPCFNYYCKITQAVYGFVFFRLICFLIQTILY